MEIMTKEHPAWEEYLERLHDLVYDHAQFKSDRDCDGTLRHTRRILSHMGGINVDESIRHIEANVGECDSDVLAVAYFK